MCGRYNLIPDGAAWGAVDEIFGAEIAQQLREIATRYNVAPTQMVPIDLTGAFRSELNEAIHLERGAGDGEERIHP